ncbi:hypothetical protein B0H21DRAFT_721779 [Amylocystis lapponica]|nr:hypothetical protein B0H21DRAFT_721779 [Amylocystis lapponica]
MKPTVTPESQADPAKVPPLDPSLLKLSEADSIFLHATISNDDAELRRRILEVQEEAYAKYPYPCIHAFHYVSLFMSQNPAYPSVMAAAKSAPDTLFLDIGCCMGSDVRKLVFDGYPAARVLASDLRREYITLGHTLYQDLDTCPIRFFTSDIFSLAPDASKSLTAPVRVPEVTDLAELRGALTHIYVGALFHLFDEATQYALALRLAVLLRRSPGALVFGRHSGLEEAGMIDDHLGRTRYGHSPESWVHMWKHVFVEVEGAAFSDTRVVVLAHLEDHKYNFLTTQRRAMLVWSISIM